MPSPLSITAVPATGDVRTKSVSASKPRLLRVVPAGNSWVSSIMVTAVPEAVFVVISISVLFALAAIAVGVSIPSPSLVALLVDSDAVTPSSALLICVTAACIMARESVMPVIGTLNVVSSTTSEKVLAASILPVPV